MKCLSFLLVSLIFSSLKAEVVLQDIKTSVENGKAQIEYVFNQNIDPRRLAFDYINETLQIDVPNAFIEEKKRFTNLDDDKIRNLYTYQFDKETLRLRIIYKPGNDANQLQGNVETKFKDNRLIVKVNDGRAPLRSNVATKLPVKIQAPVIQVEDIEPRGEAANISTTSQQLNNEDENVAGDVKEMNEEKIKVSSLDEASIPVLQKASVKQEASARGFFSRVFFSFVALLGVFLAFFLILKRWSKIKMKNPHTHIKVLTQHHMGPKKSLAIISVAGESMLIGMTDHSINLIKELTLLDEEIPETTSSKFDEAYEDAESRVDDEDMVSDKDEFNILGIKDVVKTKLKNMRDL